jgi:hypothetical protein
MVPTIFGGIVALLGCWFLTKPIAWTFGLMIVASEFAAASAINLPAVGGSTVTPAHLALGFVIIRLLMDRQLSLQAWLEASEENLFLIGFVAYSAVTAFILPRMFQGELQLIPLRDTVNGHVLGPQPLKLSNQNLTTAVYLVGTALIALCAGLVARRRDASAKIVATLLAVGWLHVAFGVLDLALTAVGQQGMLNVFRNGSYAQLNQEVSGLRRISGVDAETSAYSQYGIVFLVFASELWLRGVMPRRSGPLSLAMLFLLAITTSSSAYIGLGAYALLLAGRIAFVPGGSKPALILSIAAVGLTAVAALLAIAAFEPGAMTKLVTVVTDMTINKQASLSGRQRALAAAQGLRAFTATNGLGVGAGSFRSSSLFTAVIGSTGVIGSLFLAIYVAQMAKPLRRSTYLAAVDGARGAGVAAGWAALIGLAPMMFTAASPDPGLLFALFAGLAIGWRGREAASALPPLRPPEPSQARAIPAGRALTVRAAAP